MQRHPAIYVSKTQEKGRGVFTAVDLEKGELIEICPVVVINESQKKVLHKTIMHDYYFNWGINDQCAAIALGFGSIFNHANESNVDFEMDYGDQNIIFKTSNKVPAGTELTINYFESEGKETLPWFEIKK